MVSIDDSDGSDVGFCSVRCAAGTLKAAAQHTDTARAQARIMSCKGVDERNVLHSIALKLSFFTLVKKKLWSVRYVVGR